LALSSLYQIMPSTVLHSCPPQEDQGKASCTGNIWGKTLSVWHIPSDSDPLGSWVASSGMLRHYVGVSMPKKKVAFQDNHWDFDPLPFLRSSQYLMLQCFEIFSLFCIFSVFGVRIEELDFLM
jgi:hypothetical protein